MIITLYFLLHTGSVPELGHLNTTEEHSVHFWLVNRYIWHFSFQDMNLTVWDCFVSDMFFRVTRKDPIRSNVTDKRLFGGAYNSQKPTIVLVVGYGHAPGTSLFADQLTEGNKF